MYLQGSLLPDSRTGYKIWKLAKQLSFQVGSTEIGGIMAKVQVGLIKDVAAEGMKGFRAGDKPVLVSNIEGKFYAIGDKCTHRGCSLSKGRKEGDVVTCPCHGYRFNLKTGAVVRGPAENPEPSYPATLEGDGIWVGV